MAWVAGLGRAPARVRVRVHAQDLYAHAVLPQGLEPRGCALGGALAEELAAPELRLPPRRQRQIRF